MSVASVRWTMGVVAKDAIEYNDGVISGEAFNRAVTEANRGLLTPGEREALLNPHRYLDANTNVDVSKLTFSAEARKTAEGLVGDEGFEIFPNFTVLPETHPVPSAPAATTVREEFEALLARGKDLGGFRDWKLSTAGADVTFSTKAAGRDWPALILDTRTFRDPEAPRNLVAENLAAFAACTSVEEFEGVVNDIVSREAAYFAADGVAVKSSNERYGVCNLRRKLFVNDLQKEGIKTTKLGDDDQRRARGVAVKVGIQLVDGIDYKMEIGSHQNYWPYWKNFAAPLEKMLAQQEVGSPAYFQLKNRLHDIYRRKTSNESWQRNVIERDFESSVQMALVYDPLFTVGVGHRVSAAEGSATFDPRYELLTVQSDSDRLPEELKQYAGVQVYRDTDADKTLRFDYMGEGTESRAGTAIPAELQEHIQHKTLSKSDLDALSLRYFKGSEQSRRGISMDWDGNGSINVAKTQIGWWGHCHNEAPLNAMGIDPQKGATLYVANRGVDTSKALVEYSAEDAWDIAGAMMADHEGRPEWALANSGTGSYSVDNTSFEGFRNDGGNHLRLELSDGTAIEADAEVMSYRDHEGKAHNPKSMFREHLENDDGTFDTNPQYVKTTNQDAITLDVAGSSMSLATEYFTFGGDGHPVKREASVTLDPTADRFVKLSETIKRQNTFPELGGEVVEHLYNAKTNQYRAVTKTYSKDNGFAGEEGAAAAEPVLVKSLHHRTETQYDSPRALYDYFMDNPGLPKTYDTTSGKAVWNYPIAREQLSLLNEATRVEGGTTYTYRTFSLDYDSMGGPNKEQSFILKFNEAGTIVGGCSLDPMIDFAFRNDHWVSAPITTDRNGRIAYNVMALDKGYLLRDGSAGLDGIEASLWENEATLLYASLTDETAADHAYIFKTADGRVVSFDNKADFDGAVEADKRLRAEERGELRSSL